MPREGFYHDGEEEDTEPQEEEEEERTVRYERERSRSRSREQSRARHGQRQNRSRGRTGPRDNDDGEGGARSSPTHSRPFSFVGRSFLTSGENNTVTSSAEIPANLEERVALRVSETVTNSLREQLLGVLKEKEEKSNGFAKEVEALQAAQRHASLLSEATELQSESAQRQFIAFAKVKSAVVNAKRLMVAGDVTGAESELAEVEKIADFRIDMIRRADSMPGGWAAANLYERKASGQVNQKNDKMWRSAVEEASDARKMKGKGKAGAGNSNATFQASATSGSRPRWSCYSCGATTHISSDPACPNRSLSAFGHDQRRANCNRQGGPVLPQYRSGSSPVSPSTN